MKRLLFILAAMLIAGYASAQWDIEGYTVYKDDGHKDDRYNRIIIKKDSIKFKQARAVRFRGTKEIDFYKMVNRLAHEVFTDDDLIHLSKDLNRSDASFIAFVQHDGTITIRSLRIPCKDEKIFTQDKIEKWLNFWKDKNFKGYFELIQEPDLPLDEFVGTFSFHIFCLVGDDSKYGDSPYYRRVEESSPWNIKGYSVYKNFKDEDDKSKGFIIKMDSSKFKEVHFMVLGAKKSDFYKMVNRLARQVFTDDDLIHLSKGTNYSDASCSAFVQPDGTITIYALGFPYEDAKIFTQAKIEKWMKLWENENLQGYVEFFRKPDIPSDKAVGQFLFSVFYFGDD